MSSTILNVCNEQIRDKENVAQLQWLQERVTFASAVTALTFRGHVPKINARRRLLYSGTLIKVKSKKELVGFLFNDMLFLTQPSKEGPFSLPLQPSPSLKITFKAYRMPIPLFQVSQFPSCCRQCNSCVLAVFLLCWLD